MLWTHMLPTDVGQKMNRNLQPLLHCQKRWFLELYIIIHPLSPLIIHGLWWGAWSCRKVQSPHPANQVLAAWHQMDQVQPTHQVVPSLGLWHLPYNPLTIGDFHHPRCLQNWPTLVVKSTFHLKEGWMTLWLSCFARTKSQNSSHRKLYGVLW